MKRAQVFQSRRGLSFQERPIGVEALIFGASGEAERRSERVFCVKRGRTTAQLTRTTRSRTRHTPRSGATRACFYFRYYFARRAGTIWSRALVLVFFCRLQGPRIVAASDCRHRPLEPRSLKFLSLIVVTFRLHGRRSQKHTWGLPRVGLRDRSFHLDSFVSDSSLVAP